MSNVILGVAIIDPQYEFWPHGMIIPGIREIVIGFKVPCFGGGGIRVGVVFCENDLELHEVARLAVDARRTGSNRDQKVAD